jgi:hypothetical protein
MEVNPDWHRKITRYGWHFDAGRECSRYDGSGDLAISSSAREPWNFAEHIGFDLDANG